MQDQYDTYAEIAKYLSDATVSSPNAMAFITAVNAWAKVNIGTDKYFQTGSITAELLKAFEKLSGFSFGVTD